MSLVTINFADLGLGFLFMIYLYSDVDSIFISCSSQLNLSTLWIRFRVFAIFCGRCRDILSLFLSCYGELPYGVLYLVISVDAV